MIDASALQHVGVPAPPLLVVHAAVASRAASASRSIIDHEDTPSWSFGSRIRPLRPSHIRHRGRWTRGRRCHMEFALNAPPGGPTIPATDPGCVRACVPP